MRQHRLPLLASIAAALALPAAPQTGPDGAVIHSETRVVLVNVVAKDKHGKPVSDLARDDFVLRDNGQEQKIGLFAIEKFDPSEHARLGSESEATFTNRPGVAGVTAFLFDQLNTQLADQELAKKDFLHYLHDLPAGSRVAVFVLGDSLALLHDFTEDQASLAQAVSKHANRVNPEVAAATPPPASANSLTGDQTTDAKWNDFMKSSSQPYVDYTEMVRATRTAAALETIAGHLQGIPGRKTLIWISGGFPIQLGLHNHVDKIPDSGSTSRAFAGGGGRGKQGGGGRLTGSDIERNASSSTNSSGNTSTAPTELPGTGTSFESDVARAIRALNEADVAVYPIDARGVTVAGPFQADRTSIAKRGKRPSANFGPNYNFETLESLAIETGGVAFQHINDLNQAIEEAAADARVSYSLTFSPASASLDGLYHKIELAVKRPDVKLRYRPGYVAAREGALAPTLAEAIANPIDVAGVGFTVHFDKVEGGYKASAVIDPRNVTLEPKDGKWVGSLQFLAVVGKVEQVMTIPLDFNEATFRQVEAQGLHFSARVKTPPGVTGVTLAFRDVPSGMVGTLHIPSGLPAR